MPTALPDADVAAIERATLAAVAPTKVIEQAGWLLAVSPGSLRRAQSAVPLVHALPGASDTVTHLKAAMARLSTVYRQAGLPPVFRLPTGHALLEQAAAELGLAQSGCNAVMVGSTAELIQRVDQRDRNHPLAEAPVQVRAQTRPDAAWQSLFLGEGFDPVDGQCRIDHLSRSTCNRYFTAWLGSEPVACGAAAVANGWFSVHGMRTAAAHRGKGLASAVLRSMANEALQAGWTRMFLQVEADNRAAVSLYTGLGLRDAWCYAYWRG